MYAPLQIPYILNKEFAKSIKYQEESAAKCSGFLICFWNMTPIIENKTLTSNIIVADGCIDLVSNFDQKQIGFAGMRKTNFDFAATPSERFIGARMMPGAFYELTGLPAISAMDTFLPLDTVFPEFDEAQYFSLTFEEAKRYFQNFLYQKTQNKVPNKFTLLFEFLSENPFQTTKELYDFLHFSPRQCQRLFMKYYGISPKMVLSIIRFQKSLQILLQNETKDSNIAQQTGFYDQPHFIKDFKNNIGITPQELFRIYKA